MQGLKKQITEKDFHQIYLFYGEEKYLIDFYLNKVRDTALSNGDITMNYDHFDSNVDIDKVCDAIETLPFLSDVRVIIVNDSKLFKSGKKNDTEKLADKLKNIPDSTIILFVEEEVDKRNKLYKTINSNGYVVEFKKLTENDLSKWVAKKLHAFNKKIEKDTALHFLKTVGTDMTTINNELDKLIMYDYNSNIITKDSIDAICIRTIDNRIFELVNAMGQKNRHKAILLYNDLLFLKEPPARILFMLIRQFRLILQCKLLSHKGLNESMIAKKIKLAPFIVRECLKQSRNFNEKTLTNALSDCLETDTNIKSGKVDAKIGVEIIIMKYSN